MNGLNDELYSGLQGGLILVWDMVSNKVKLNLQGHSTEVKTMKICKMDENPLILFSGSLDGKIKIWDLRGKNSHINLRGHVDSVKCFSLSPDHNYLASGADDSLVKLWDLRQNKLIKEFSSPDQNSVNCIEFNPHCMTMAFGSNDKTIKHWDLEEFQIISMTPLDKLPVNKIQFDSTGENIFVGTNETLKYWKISDSNPVLIYMVEIGWNNLQDMKFNENCGLSCK